ncbi:MAG: outer membrane protein assembly factor BamD [Polaromonas sp.]
MLFKLSALQATTRTATAVLILGGLLAGCASTPVDPTAGWSPNKIYSEAKDEAASGAFEKSIGLYEKLEGRAAGTPLAQQAQLEKAYTQYRNGDKVQAIATLDRFVRLHPASSALDYALYSKGLVNFNDKLGLFSSWVSQDLSERDQKSAKESFESFKELATRFPESKYTPDARLRMTYIVNSLAESEVHVARFYYSRGAYVASINRAQIAIADYRDVPAIEEALSLIYRSYDALGMTQLRDDTLRVMQTNYPDSPFTRRDVKAKRAVWYKFW